MKLKRTNPKFVQKELQAQKKIRDKKHSEKIKHLKENKFNIWELNKIPTEIQFQNYETDPNIATAVFRLMAGIPTTKQDFEQFNHDKGQIINNYLLFWN